MKINNLNNRSLKSPAVKNIKKQDELLQVKDGVELGKNLDTAGIAGGTIGGLAGGAGIGYLGMCSGAYVGLFSNLFSIPANFGEALGRISTGGIIGGAIGAVSGAVVGACVGKVVSDYVTGKKSFTRTVDNPDVSRVGNKGDNFDKFKGIDLKFVRIGEFSEGPNKSEVKEEVKTKDIIADAENKAKKQVKDYVGSVDTFKPDIKTVRVEDKGIIHHIITEEETFKGVAIGKNLKIGKSHVEESDSTVNKADYSFKSKINHPYADITTTMKGTLAEIGDEKIETEDRTLFFK